MVSPIISDFSPTRMINLTNTFAISFNGSTESLILYENMLTGTIPTSIGQLKTSLHYIDFSFNSLRGSIPEDFYRLNSLTGVILSSNNLDGTLLEKLGDLDALRDFWVDNNNISGSIPNSIGKLWELGELVFKPFFAIVIFLSSYTHKVNLIILYSI